MEFQEICNQLDHLKARLQKIKDFLQIGDLEARLAEIEKLTSDPEIWNDNEKAKELLQERSKKQETVNNISKLSTKLSDLYDIQELVQDSPDSELLDEATQTYTALLKDLDQQEFVCKMRGEHDDSPAILEINGGAGGTESQDWAEMLLRMYTRWAERKNFTTEILEYHAGEEAGIKSCTILINGPYAYGYLKAEQGIHRLVRISPFDSNAKRHTSFASVSLTPDIQSEIEVEIDEVDLRIDTYRASGAGGQHVNKTDSAVRITHVPTNTVVACQSERSQHRNKDRAMKMLKIKLYEILEEQQAEKLDEVKGERKKIDFGSQIRSYVLHPYQMVKDLRSNHETSNTSAVLDGDLDALIESVLLLKD